jgi:hypothetical protein
MMMKPQFLIDPKGLVVVTWVADFNRTIKIVAAFSKVPIQ